MKPIDVIKIIYHKYSDTKLFIALNNIYIDGFFINNWIASQRVRRQVRSSKGIHDFPIRVAFICQDTKEWNKLRCVYENMRRDKRFEVCAIALEPMGQDNAENVYSFLERLYGDDAVRGIDGKEKFDLKAWKPHYVFSCNPYDQYFPSEFKSGSIAKYAKNCFIDYGYELSITTVKVAFEKKYFRNVYFLFAENEYVAAYNRNRYINDHARGYRKTVTIGYPAFEYFYQQKKEKEDNKYTVVWTPRWTEDKNLGGSNFLNFKDKVLKYSLEHEDIRLVFRPHPMTFNHFIEIGKITKEEVECYLTYFAPGTNRIYDDTADYTNTFWQSDVLLTDFSSILVEYFLTGKPIIYCDTGAQLNESVAEMIDAMYVVNNWEEAEKILKQLQKGVDPLKDIRKETIRKVFGDDFEKISDRFLDTLYDDFIN